MKKLEVPQYLLESTRKDLEKAAKQLELIINKQKLLDSIKNVRKEKKKVQS